MSSNKKYLIVIAGPTASGKTEIAVKLAKEFHTSVISADSRQFFKEMKIGTARPSEEELEGVPHYFLGTHSVKENYNIGKYEEEVLSLLSKLFKEKNIVILAGGSGLYIKMICEGLDEMPDADLEIRKELQEILDEKGLDFLAEELKRVDPEYYEQMDKNNPQRVMRAVEVFRSTGIPFSLFRKGEKKKRNFESIKIGIHWDRDELYRRIDRRVDEMLEQGLFEEAENLFSMKDYNALQTVGYREIFEYMEGKYDKEEAVRLIKRNTRRFAKRQVTWFGKDDQIRWFRNGEVAEIVKYIKLTIQS
jgi:tRNA dimethylallyltransferase